MSSCCPEGSEPPRATSPHVGSIKRFGNTDLYVTGPATAKVGIISYPDVFGYDSGRSKSDADRLAQEEGYAVVVVDVTGGNYMGMDSTMDHGAVWLKAQDFNRDIKSHVEDTIVYLKQEAQVQAICTYGYCFGAWVGARVSVNADPVLKGHVSFHPSWVAELLLEGEGAVEKMTKAITIPQLLLAASNDPEFVREGGSVDQILKANATLVPLSEVVNFDEVVHGWVNRGDLSDPKVAAAADEAWSRARAFFKSVL